MPSPRIHEVLQNVGPACRAGLSPQSEPDAGHGLLQPRRAGVISGGLHLIWHGFCSQVAAGPRSPARQAGPALLTGLDERQQQFYRRTGTSARRSPRRAEVPVLQQVIRFLPLALRRFVWLLIVCLAATCLNDANADEENSAVQKQISAVCQNLQAATVRLRSGSDVSSGVVVSKKGLILTVAHGLKSSSDKVLVLLPGGSSCEAKPLVVDEAADVALLEMDAASLPIAEWDTVPISAVAQASVGDVVLAAGFPARELDALTAVVRLGQILPVNKSVPMSSCTLTSGDSGGPLVNSRGELIGLHRQIGEGLESNGYISLTVIRRVLEQSRHWTTLTERNNSPERALLPSKELSPASYKLDAGRRVTVEILGGDVESVSAVRSLGTVLNAHQVATKLSEIYPYRSLQCRWSSGLTIAATLKQSDREHDLAILELADLYDGGDEVEAAILKSRNSPVHAGQIVFAAVSPTGFAATGIISRVGHDESGLPPRFGATMQADNEILRITELAPNGSAMRAGLMVGDELRQIDMTGMVSLQDIADVFTARQPGDWLTLGIRRRAELTTTQAQLQFDPSLKFEKTEFLDGRTGRVSQRRSGFHGVLQHDAAIDPEACGGPLFDINGKLIAVNIARRARESTLAIPIGDVLKLAAKSNTP